MGIVGSLKDQVGEEAGLGKGGPAGDRDQRRGAERTGAVVGARATGMTRK